MLNVAHGGNGTAQRSRALRGLAGPSANMTLNDGVWTEIPSPTRGGHTAIYDPVRDRMLVFGGWDGSFHNDVWELSLAGSPHWSQLTPAGVPPPSRIGHAAIYDPVRDRMVVFGGGSGFFRNDVWALSLSGDPAWSAIATAGTRPSARYGHAAIYDPVRDRLVVFGGYRQDDGSDHYLNDVWALSLAGNPTWSALAPAGETPSARFLHAAIYDGEHDRMVVFGGSDAQLGELPVGNRGFRNDVWALSFAGIHAWSELTPGGPPPPGRNGHTAIYDAVRSRMVVFGGYSYDGTDHYYHDVWSLSLEGNSVWSALASTEDLPSERYLHSGIFDPVRDRMVMFGGGSNGGFRNDLWALSLAGSPAWAALGPLGTPPSGRTSPTVIYDPVRDRMVVFGGQRQDGLDHYFSNDVWAFSLTGNPAWSALTPAGAPPSGRSRHTAIYDPVRDRMIVFGGGFRTDVWALSLAGSSAWSELTPGGETSPPARFGHTAIYDPVRDRMVVFGGAGGGLLNDVWALSLGGSPAWSELTPAGDTPAARVDHTAIYDPVRDRMVVFGGNDYVQGPYYRNDTWALSLAGIPAWSALTPAGSPPSRRFLHAAIYDPVRDRMVVFGGSTEDDSDHFLNDAWTLSLANSPTWQALTPEGTPPPGRYGTTAAYDLVRDRMMVFGGFDGVSYRNDVWGLGWPGTPTAVIASLVSLDAQAGRIRLVWHVSANDDVAARLYRRTIESDWTLVAQIGPDGTEYVRYEDVAVTTGTRYGYRLGIMIDGEEVFAGEVWAEVPTVRLALRGATPNPALDGRLNVEFSLRDGTTAKLELLDVAGRLLASKEVGALGVGTHSLLLSEGGVVRPGVYFLRLTQGGSEVRSRAAVLR